MTTKQTTRSENTSLADLDPDQLSDSDELYHMAQAMREDEYFEVPIVNWTKEGTKVIITIVTPNGTTAKVKEDWPSKPTEDNGFVRACMCALDVDDPQAAALMADELQDVNHDEFTVPADRPREQKWKLKPEAASTASLTKRVQHAITGDENTTSLSTPLKVASFIGGPVSMAIGTIFHWIDEPGAIWDDDISAEAMWPYVQAMWYCMWGTIVWILTALLLL